MPNYKVHVITVIVNQKWVNNGVNCSRIRNDWFGIGSGRGRGRALAWRVLRSLFLFSRTSLQPSDFGLPGIGFKPSFILSGRPPSVLARRMFWLEANFFPHAIRSPEEKGGLKRRREMEPRSMQKRARGAVWLQSGPNHPPFAPPCRP